MTASAWADRVAWITGASSGLGEAMARRLSAQGAQVILSGRREAELARVASELVGPSFILPFEATDFQALPQQVAEAWAWRGRVDLLVNNAGVSQRSLALDTDFEVYRRLIDIDLLSPIRLTQLALPRMVAAGGGQIAIMSSLAGKIGAPLRTGYCAAKHGCVGYFEALRAEVETAYGVGVTVILPGSVRTGIARNALASDGTSWDRHDPNIDSGLAPEDAAATIVAGLLARDREIVLAHGAERTAFDLRRDRPDQLFDALAADGLRLARTRDGGAADPAPVAEVI